MKELSINKVDLMDKSLGEKLTWILTPHNTPKINYKWI